VNSVRSITALIALATLVGCATEGVDIQGPVTARPVAQARAPQQNGAIFQDGVSYRPMFEDRRARYIGDTLTIAIAEKTQASRSGDLTAKRAAKLDGSVDNVTKLGPLNKLQGTGVGAKISSDIDTADSASANNLFNGSITVTVVDVLPNGNLLVAGEKRLGINGEIETLRFSGVVNPFYIVNGNSVSSVNVADARIESKAHSTVEPAQVAGFLARFFLSFLPFR
jgi:flagellar L-ring protein precursor FlgH